MAAHCLEQSWCSVNVGVYRITLRASLLPFGHLPLASILPKSWFSKCCKCCLVWPCLSHNPLHGWMPYNRASSHFIECCVLWITRQQDHFLGMSRVYQFFKPSCWERGHIHPQRVLLDQFHLAVEPLIWGKFLGPSQFCFRKQTLDLMRESSGSRKGGIVGLQKVKSPNKQHKTPWNIPC